MLTRVATLAVVAAAAVAGCGEAGAPARPAGMAVDPQLRELDGVYAAEITEADLRRLRSSRTAPSGVWKIAIRARKRTVEVSAPEGPDSGSYTLDITHAAPGRLTLAPDRTCERPSGRVRPAEVAYSLQRSTLVFTYAHGGCSSAWLLLRSTPWHKA